VWLILMIIKSCLSTQDRRSLQQRCYTLRIYSSLTTSSEGQGADRLWIFNLFKFSLVTSGDQVVRSDLPAGRQVEPPFNHSLLCLAEQSWAFHFFSNISQCSSFIAPRSKKDVPLLPPLIPDFMAFFRFSGVIEGTNNPL
jgi:hypothetical protein